MSLIVYEKNNTVLNKYHLGDVEPIALKIADRFYNICKYYIKITKSENELFNLFIKTFNPSASDNKHWQMKNMDELIDAVNMFDKILIALSSEKGLNLFKVYLVMGKCKIFPNKFKPYLMLDWNID
tara:strand:- start:457 stop:834 length:378 start_codon:yes stop_codon:yes gene_type:complete